MTSLQPADQTLPWQSVDFLSEADAWIRQQAEAAGLPVTGEIEQTHAAWWSTVLRAPTEDGPIWFKAVRAKDAFEPRLTALLGAIAPRQTVEVLATEVERGWMLTRDAGIRLRELQGPLPQVEHWERLLPRYAELQITLADRVADLLGMGVPDLRLAVLPAELAAVLDEPEMLMLDATDGVSSSELERLRDGVAAFAELCMRLAEFGIQETLQHDDLNDGNVFVRDGQYLPFDWGDACVSHPFHSLVVTLRAAAYKQHWQPGGPEVGRLLDAYLEPWERFGTREELRAAANLARRTGTIQRSLAWRQSVMDMPAAVRDEYVDSIPYGVRLYLMNGPWGTWDDGSF